MSLRQTTRTAEQSLHGRQLIFARIVWVVLVVLALGLFVVSMPSYFAYLHIFSKTPALDAGVQISRQDAQQLEVVGLSIDFYAWFNVLLNGIFILSFSLVGIVLFLRKSENRVALFASFTLVMFSLDQNSNILLTLPSGWKVPVIGVNFLGSLSISLFFLLFPNGRLVPRWTRWLAIALVLYWITDIFLPPPSTLIAQLLNFAVFLLLEGSLVVVQIYRYHRLSSPVERQQIKWVVYGTSLGLGGYLIGSIVVFALLRNAFHLNMVLFIIGYTLLDGLLLLFPLSIGVAILRSRLWDIDTLINRTLVYSTLTVSLALIYTGLVLGLQALLSGLLHQTNAISLVVSTLAIAALFQPLRRRIQMVVDRRFYRRKYDAAKTLVAFSAALRSEVDLSHLSEHLLSIVQETMQPTHVSLWLRQTEQAKTVNTGSLSKE